MSRPGIPLHSPTGIVKMVLPVTSRKSKISQQDNEYHLRELSKKIFGLPNNPLKIEVKNLYDLFGKDIEKLSFEELQNFALSNPEIQKLTHSTLVREPLPPIKNTIVSTCNFLQRSRFYRMLFPMGDKLSKMSCAPSNDSTRLKFEIGVDLKDAYHIGSGSVIASSVPEAQYRIDIRTGNNAFKAKMPDGVKLIVSDLSMPTQDGLGCSSNPMLVAWLEKFALLGYKIIAKLTIEDVISLKIPFRFVCKPRAHNTEWIVTFNIPGVDLMSLDDLLQSIIDANVWRNKQCAQGFIDSAKTLDMSQFDETLLADPRDYTPYGVLDKLPFHSKNRRLRDEKTKFDKNKCMSMINAGFLQLTDNVNMYTVQQISDFDTIEERIEFLSQFHTEEDVASIVILMRFVVRGTINLTRNGKIWHPSQEKKF
jgi:hypothetical protein